MISKFSVKKPYTVLVGVVLAIVLGIVSFTKMTADLLPNISLPYVIVMTTYPGASPETVEMVVTSPVEAGMATVSNIESISSVSSENYSLVILEFAQSADMNAVSLEIRESLDQIKAYWDDSVGNPIIMKLNPDMLPIMIAAVGMDGMDNAQISTYVQEAVVPEIESLEGVASVSTTGLLEESVNVIIRQDKIDEINEKIFAAIDDKMAEAEEELADGRKAIEDGKKELADGRRELNNGRSEMSNGEKELSDGKKELDSKRDEANTTLANTKKDLLTAKTDLEATKMNMVTNLETAKGLNQALKAVDAVENPFAGAASAYREAYMQLAGSVSSGDAAGAEAARAQINTLKKSITENNMLQQAAAGNETATAALNNLKALDWADVSNPGTFQIVYGSLSALTPMYQAAVEAQTADLRSALVAITNGMGYEAYEKLATETIATLDEKLALVNAGLVEVEKGQLTAAIEFANANSQITLGEYQMELAKAQMDTAAEQLDSGLDQLKDAEQQLKEGEEQLADAKETAYERADMTGILTVETVKGLLAAQNFTMPAGYVTEEGIDYLVRVGDRPDSVEALSALPLMDMHMEGVPVITLGDVADVFYTDNSDSIYTNVNGSAGIMLTIQKQTGYSTGEVSDRLAERFERLMNNDERLSILTLMDQGIYIDLVMDSILSNILFGAALAILILLLFLKDVRPTIIIAFSIPISLVTAIVCMYFSGVTLNIISLSGLALGIGMLVDNSIVVIENIYRLRGEGQSMKEAAIAGTKEVAGAIMASTLTTICVFLPIVFTEGITRQLFVDMGLTIAYSLLASLVVALTVVPAMSSKVLVRAKEQKESKIFDKLSGWYEKLLAVALRRKPVVFTIVLVLLALSVVAALSNGTAFMGDMDSTQLTVSVRLDDNATLQETGALTDKVVEAIMEIPDVQDVGAMTGSSSLLGFGGNSSTNTADIYVVTKEERAVSNEELADMILERTAELEAEITVDTSSMDMSALGGSGIVIQVRGRDLDTLRAIATDVAKVVESVEGTAQVQDGLGESSEELRVVIDRDEAVEYGLTVAQVFAQISSKLAEASSATTLVTAEKDYSVYVMSGNDIELTRALLREIEITGTGEEGESVKLPLSDIATFESAMSLDAINRADQTRYVSVTASIADGYNVGLVSNAVERKLAGYEMPEGYRLVYSGENETINDALEQLVLMLVLALVFMYLIMVAQFQSLLSPFIIMFTIPLAFTGGFMGLFISGSEISVIAMIGFVMLSGIIVNNGIVLIDYMNQLRENGVPKREAILNAGRTRLRPVLMTALTTILGLSTMVFSNAMGAEMAKPMAVVTIGGLFYGTLLTLVVIPCVYDIFTKKDQSDTISEPIGDLTEDNE
ncbi:MAG: efflux RND transporter permease subunit [Lachnospiraceae bacterium]|nr:efflux RND transporter permease subunit [Lachnospiraceae bacterium]